jgi:choline dehydrogenase-like flavoprotein
MKPHVSDHDVAIVGSGAAGGIAAYVLTQRGLKVLLLEAGRHYDPVAETPMFQVESEAPLNGAPTPDKQDGFYSATVDGGFQVPGEPYTSAEGSQVGWWRARMLGGRTNHWGRTTLRYGPYDFRTRSRNGIGMDWPISYEDVAPYYDRVEKLIGVFGAAEGIENSPDSPSGILMPPPPPRPYERWVQLALQKHFGIRTVANHAAILTEPLNGRPACIYATSCDRGCAIRANFQTPTVLLPPALATGRLEVRARAMVHQVILNARGRASGVEYIDTLTRARHFARARSVVLAASSCETARILLNSKSTSFPDGLANASGQVGRNLTNTSTAFVTGDIPVLQDLGPFNDDGATVCHAYVPWWGHKEQAAGRLNFSTEYHIQLIGGRSMPLVQDFTDLPSEAGKPLYGEPLRARLRKSFGSRVTLLAVGGMIPNDDSRCEIDPTVKDHWGIPVLRFRWKWGGQELAQMRHATAALSDMVSAMGGVPLSSPAGGTDAATRSVALMHEAGTARMGATANDSVLNSWGYAWDVRNLYVTDGASFTGHADKNPTHTIMALAWRASDHLADSLLRREI